MRQSQRRRLTLENVLLRRQISNVETETAISTYCSQNRAKMKTKAQPTKNGKKVKTGRLKRWIPWYWSTMSFRLAFPSHRNNGIDKSVTWPQLQLRWKTKWSFDYRKLKQQSSDVSSLVSLQIAGREQDRKSERSKVAMTTTPTTSHTPNLISLIVKSSSTPDKRYQLETVCVPVPVLPQVHRTTMERSMELLTNSNPFRITNNCSTLQQKGNVLLETMRRISKLFPRNSSRSRVEILHRDVKNPQTCFFYSFLFFLSASPTPFFPFFFFFFFYFHFIVSFTFFFSLSLSFFIIILVPIILVSFLLHFCFVAAPSSYRKCQHNDEDKQAEKKKS